METMIFCVTMCLFMAIIFIGVGVIIGDAKNFYQRKLGMDHSDNDVPVDNPDRNNSDLGMDYEEGLLRYDLGQGCYKKGQITPGCTVSALGQIRREMKTMLSNTEKDALIYAEKCVIACATQKGEGNNRETNKNDR